MSIVTITSNAFRAVYDMEFPDEVPVHKLTRDAIESINAASGMNLDYRNFAMVCNRTNQVLNAEQTLSEAGVWNGDYLTLVFVS